MKIISCVFACALAVVAAALPQAASAQSTAPNAILILDASGSMWGQTEGRTKIAAARGAVDRILSSWRPDDRLGLMAYGHRSRGDCRDIELVVPVGPVRAEAFREAVGQLNPRGKTPIAAALREAAGILKSTEERATVILVSDGIETCEPDPCAVAGELKKAGIGFTAHVVGFDVTDPAARAQLQCIAGATGGVYLDARNASGLETAMTKAAEAARGQTVVSEAPSVPRQTAPVDPLAGKNLRATARLAEGSDPLTDEKLVWGIYRPDTDGKAGEHLRNEYNSPRLATAIEPGQYILKVEYGSVTREYPVTVESGKAASLDAVLDAGFLSGTASVPGGTLTEPVTWEIHADGGGHVVSDYTLAPAFVLPAGSYKLKLVKGHAAAERSFTLAAGESGNVAIELQVGRLVVDATYSDKGPPVAKGLVVELRQPRPNPEEAGAIITAGYDPKSIFEAAAGSYDLIVGAGEARREVKAEIVSGKDTRLTINIDAGVVVLTAPAGSTIEVFDKEVSIEGARKHIVTGYDGKLDTVLPAGEFVAVVSRESEKVGQTPFAVTAGKRLELALK